MRDEIENNPKLFFSIVVTGIIFTIVLVVFLLIAIWSGNDNTTSSNGNNQVLDLETGKYQYKTTSEAAVVENYCNNIIDVLSMRDKDEIYNFVLPEYVNYRGYNKDTLYNSLSNRGLLGKLLKFYGYKSAYNTRYGRVFEIQVGTYDSSVIENILLIESSPRNYKISFDGFIGDTNVSKEIIRNGIKITITNIKEFINEMEIKVNISNVSGSNITINKEANYENIYLKLSNGTEVRTSSVWLSGVTKVLGKNDFVNLDLKFIPGYLLTGSAKAIVIKDVYDDISRETKDIEFPM